MPEEAAESRKPARAVTPLATAALRRAHESAQLRHPDVRLGLELFTRDVVRLVSVARGRLDLSDDEAELSAAIPHRALEDLFLARACEHGCNAAWTTLQTTYRARLVGLARRRARAPGSAEDAVDDLLSDLALPPAGGATRTRLGSFDGSGSLWGWLAATLVRRLLRGGRDRARPTGETLEHLLPPSDASPEDALAADEAATTFSTTLESAWSRLTEQERCALVWKHRHGLRQRRIAGLLGVREDRVSRWISRAVTKLAGAVGGSIPGGTGPSDGLRWEALRQVLEACLASSAARAPPPDGEPPTRESP